MTISDAASKGTYRHIDHRNLASLPQLQGLPEEHRRGMIAAASVLPFRTNNHVVNELIDWSRVPDDPIFQLNFPQPGMLLPDDFSMISGLIASKAPADELKATANRIRRSLNPHPAGQLDLNAARIDGRVLPGMQHKYRETVLFFPSQGQTCHAYCTYCFRWPQFVGVRDLKISGGAVEDLVAFVRANPGISDVLFTGGDPMVMRTKLLRRYVEPLLEPSLEHLRTIRIGTKAPVYWPYRFVSDPDADDLLRLIGEIRASGRHVAFNVHYSHPRELEPAIAREALRRIQNAGAMVRAQAPLMRHINDDAALWADLWRTEVQLGIVPYYMFVERDTGARHYFEVPLHRCLQIFNDAYRQVSGLARTVRGPSMSATPGKIVVDAVDHIHDEKVFTLKFIQARNPAWVGRIFHARFDKKAAWLDHLEPAFGAREFFFESTAPSAAST
jgi:KamA family protein